LQGLNKDPSAFKIKTAGFTCCFLLYTNSENKMLVQLDKGLKGLDVNNIIIKLESTFTPCTICRREILLRRKMYNAKVFVESPRFKNAKGKTKKVKDNPDFKQLLKQIK
jgi:hypothetical protein